MNSAQDTGTGGQGASGQADPNYYRELNLGLLELMPLGVQLLVEVGCAEGGLGERYKQRNSQCRYIGIERFAPAAEVARTRLDRVLVADVEQLPDEGLDFKGQVDCLVYSDVLEHLVDPWRVLRQHSGWLREGGYLVASIPNVGHLQVILGLVAGQWEYAAEGLLDRTHLRYFTYQSLPQLLAQAGLAIVECRANINPYPSNSEWEQLFAPVVRALGRDMEQFRFEASVFQYLVLAVKPRAEQSVVVV